MRKFEVGKAYLTGSVIDHECVLFYTVIARTAQTVTLRDKYGEVIKCRINKVATEYHNAESVYPMGRYSMAPILSA